MYIGFGRWFQRDGTFLQQLQFDRVCFVNSSSVCLKKKKKKPSRHPLSPAKLAVQLTTVLHVFIFPVTDFIFNIDFHAFIRSSLSIAMVELLGKLLCGTLLSLPSAPSSLVNSVNWYRDCFPRRLSLNYLEFHVKSLDSNEKYPQRANHASNPRSYTQIRMARGSRWKIFFNASLLITRQSLPPSRKQKISKKKLYFNIIYYSHR